VAGLTDRVWLRAHEEEDGSVRVYRPEGHPFPPARGREGLTFHDDGRFEYRAPGSAGTAGAEEGTWRPTPDGVRVDVAGQTIPMQITEVGDDVLRLVWPHP
jgi:hypothetical protein